MEGVNIRPGEVVIQGVQVIPLKQIPDDRGTVYHMLKATDPHFLRFGEVSGDRSLEIGLVEIEHATSGGLCCCGSRCVVVPEGVWLGDRLIVIHVACLASGSQCR